MKFRGIFKPPAVPITQSPIGIAGPGQLRVGREGLEVAGFQADARTRIEAALAVILFCVVAAALVLAAGAIFAHVPPLAVNLAAGSLGGLLYFTVIGGREKHLPERPVQMMIPWASIRDASWDLRQPGAVVVEVDGEGSRRSLHFHPAGDASELLCAIRERPQRR